MATATGKGLADGEDILGIVAIGSLITNIFQIASKQSLEEQHEALKAYAAQLRNHYETMKVREKLVYNENLTLKKANEELISLTNRLVQQLVEANSEIIKLKGGAPEVPRLRKRKRIISGGGQ